MAKKVLVACGGTGAHVTLAYLRLHILGYALGYFNSKDGDALLPNLYLIDQDDGSAEGQATAWQAAFALLSRHPAKFGWDRGIRIGANTRPIAVTPLPVGTDKRWFDEPNDHLGTRYEGSDFTSLFLDQRQRAVNYSLGMMGAPALGSLLFELKKNDKDGEGTLYDAEYDYLVDACGKNSQVVVTGSGVGGTGASIAPTFAVQCAENEANVMAVMIQRWFVFATDNANQQIRNRAKKKNGQMEENEVTGLASYGEQLVRTMPTVIAGVRDSHLQVREYTADNQQPKLESHLHAVAALSCFWHFSDEPFEPGLYCMAAENPTKLTWGLKIPDGTLGELVEKAVVLERILRSLVRILNAEYRGKWWTLVPRIRDFAKRVTTDPNKTADALVDLADTYVEQLEWVKQLGSGRPPVDDRKITENYLRICKTHDRFKDKESEIKNASRLKPRQAAQALFEWAAKWVQDEPLSHAGGHAAVSARGGSFYWPQKDGQGLSFPPTEPGHLATFPIEKAKQAIGSLIEDRFHRVRQNGWPQPFAAVDHFRYLIDRTDNSALRKLELMILGLITGDLVLEQTSNADDRQTPSLTGLLKSYRKRKCVDVARYKVVWSQNKVTRTRSDEIIGFNSPLTLLCPSPDTTGSTWAKLWQRLTDSPDPERWNKDWGNRVYVKRLRGIVQMWLNQLSKQFRTEPPSWVKALRDESVDKHPVSPGQPLRIYWPGAGNEAVKVFIPQRASTAVNDYWKHILSDDNRKNELNEGEFMKIVPEFYDGVTKNDVKYTIGKFIVPDGARTGFVWYEHLSQLQASHKIKYWRYDRQNNDLLLILPDQKYAHLRNLREIRMEDMRIMECVPLAQRKIPGENHSLIDPKYPDLPIKAEYIGLLETDKGANILEEYIMKGKKVPDVVCTVGKGSAKWRLYLKGRSEPKAVTVITKEAQDVGAHWMIWPRFMSVSRDNPWSAYYLYQYSNESELYVEAMVLDGEGLKVRKRREAHHSQVHAINYDLSDRSHSGGAPIALVAKRKEEEVGIYLTDLTPRSKGGQNWEMAVDFGTSHSVAAVRPSNENRPEVVDLHAELGENRSNSNKLSKHVSQYWDEDKLTNIDVWMPTYWEQQSGNGSNQDLQSLLPTELFSKVPLENFDSSALDKWRPGEDYGIPILQLGRHDLANHILSGFKWDVDQDRFSNYTELLRQLYLAMMLEIAVAEMVMKWGGIPSKIEVTFTYPLRTSDADVKEFRKMLEERVLPQGGRTFGTEMKLFRDDGLFNESEAARGGRGNFAEIVLVGDLGGGTLDLLISAKDGLGVEFEKLASSVKLGGSLFLKHLAEKAERFLPKNAGWSTIPGECLSQLHAWIRSQGAVNLFSATAFRHKDVKLELRGFNSEPEGNNVRWAIDWYFGLIVEYMARSLVGFVIKEWDVRRKGKDKQLRQDFPDLSVKVQLRGNGWRLWYGTSTYSKIEELVKEWLYQSAKRLWEDRGAPPREAWGVPYDKNMRPKHDPTVRAVGKPRPEDVTEDEKRFKLPLSNLELLIEGKQREQLSWLSKFPMPFTGAEMEFQYVEPSMIIGMPGGRIFKVDELDDPTTRDINEKIKSSVTETVKKSIKCIDAPIAALIWEGCFESRMKSLDWGTPVKPNRGDRKAN